MERFFSFSVRLRNSPRGGSQRELNLHCAKGSCDRSCDIRVILKHAIMYDSTSISHVTICRITICSYSSNKYKNKNEKWNSHRAEGFVAKFRIRADRVRVHADHSDKSIQGAPVSRRCNSASRTMVFAISIGLRACR